MITVILIFKFFLYLFSAFLIFGPAFVWEYSDFLSTNILNNRGGSIIDEAIRISGPFLSVLTGLILLMILLQSQKDIDELGESKEN